MKEENRLKKEVEFYRHTLQLKVPFWLLTEIAEELLNNANVPYKNQKSLQAALRRFVKNRDNGVIFPSDMVQLLGMQFVFKITIRADKNHVELPEPELAYRLESMFYFVNFEKRDFFFAIFFF